MFKNIGITELIIIAVIILLLFGGKKIMELARGLSEAKKESDKAQEEVEKTVEEEK